MKRLLRAAAVELGDLRLAFGVLRMPYAWWVLAVSTFLTLAMIVLLALAAWWLAGSMHWWDAGWLRGTRIDDWLASGLGSLMVLVAGWFAFPLVMTAVAGMFLEPLADRLERTHFPGLPAPRHVPWREQMGQSLRTLLRNLGWNTLCLPLFLVPGVNILAYLMVNGLLLSREYFAVVVLRHRSSAETGRLFRAHRIGLWRGGVVLALAFLLPVVNLLAPLLATAWMVRRVWRVAGGPLRVG